jgi:hypothetical protein
VCRARRRSSPDRRGLIAAAGDWIYEHEVELPPLPDEAEEIVDFMLAASTKGMGRVGLTRALLRSQAGTEISTARRLARDEAIANALSSVTSGLDEVEAARMTAMIQYLLGARTWWFPRTLFIDRVSATVGRLAARHRRRTGPTVAGGPGGVAVFCD